MLVVGLTGGIACGKTTVANLFAELGAPVIDTDMISRQLVEPGQPALNDIIQTFGHHYLTDEGQLNRSALARYCFSHPEARKKLEAILHPKIYDEMAQQLNVLKAPYVIVVIPLLVETGRSPLIDRVLVVDCPIDQQRQRLQQRDRRSKDEIEGILQAQASRRQRLEAADDIIENNGQPEQLINDVSRLHQQYLQSS